MTECRRVFVFGSNTQGRHGKGAALEAVRKWGAIYGRPEGPQGSSFAIITKELDWRKPPVTLEEIANGVNRFLAHAEAHPEIDFRVTPVGCGLAGFAPAQIAPLFRGAPANVKLPAEFSILLNGGLK